jgi:predicted Zn-dependent protease
MVTIVHRAGLRPRLAFLLASLLLTTTAFAQAPADPRPGVDTFNAANKAYSAAQYEAAAPLYEQVVVLLPDQPVAYLYLGNSYDHLSLNAPRGSKEIIELAHKAEANYRLAASKLLALKQPGATKNAITALEMLAALYAPDRLHDSVAARDVMEKLIALTPGDPVYVFSLAKLEENAENYDAAVVALDKALALAPDDARTYAEVAGHYWDIAAHGVRLTKVREQGFIDKGMAAADKSIALAPDNADATAYKGQLIRAQAELETDKKKQQQMLKEADALAARAKELRASATTPG